ncbi:hypothetical protein PTD2_01351 [Pseudoalteromonas tunicata D2]|uniref:Uncharacterized protein n=1 Tax=Pseudoalteromonas tunicata D2 TaxID=87626 RepID=A4C3P1_9GAMM|nr:hypothetical protein PTD2_01351 [Pseudoalteromonas tunicata D2]
MAASISKNEVIVLKQIYPITSSNSYLTE